MLLRLRLILFVGSLFLLQQLHGTTPGTNVKLSQAGVPLLPIKVGPFATEVVLAAADELAQQLGRICGSPFAVVTAAAEGDGIFVGVPGDFVTPPTTTEFTPDDPWRTEEYLIRSDGTSLYLLGATPIAVEHGIWDLLERLGYRLFFLTDTWEVVPDTPDMALAVDVTVAPDYRTRLAPRQAPWTDNVLWQRWQRRNRTAADFTVNSGHSYGNIIRRNRAAFDAHPEFFALINGERQIEGDKFCISNDDLRQLVVDYATATLLASPAQETISLEPSDGGGWCECEACAALGSISDRVLLLANQAAEAINKLGLGQRYVGIYAYYQHSPPPSINGHSNVIVNVATGFIRGGYTVEQLVDGWYQSGVTIGIREYHDVFSWAHDQPRKAKGGNIAYLCETIPFFQQRQARFMNSESSDSWGGNGFGYWFSPRLLWDVKQANKADYWFNDFIDKAFGAAREPMYAFYYLLNFDQTLHDDLNVVAQMYARLSEAYATTPGTAVEARLADLVLYTRYLELYHSYRNATGEARQAGFEAVLRHVYRMRDRCMVATRAIYERNRFGDSTVEVPPEAEWSVAEPENPWKESTPFSPAEIASILAEGMAALPEEVISFEVVEYGPNLVPCTPLRPPSATPGTVSLADRGNRHYYTWLASPTSFKLNVKGGMITHYQDRGNVKIKLLARRGEELVEVDYDASVPPDNSFHEVTLTSPYAGLHRLEIADGSDKTEITWPANLPLTYHTTLEEPAPIAGTWSLYCYVPPRTALFGGFASTMKGRLRDGDGNLVFDFTSMERPGYFSVPVSASESGSFWKFESCTGHRIPLTTPPCLARLPAELLLPAEVVYYTPPEPSFGAVDSFAVTGITQRVACFSGYLATTGAAPASLTLYWGDGTTWSGSQQLGKLPLGSFTTRIEGLAPGQRYAVRAHAAHLFGEAWSEIIWFATHNKLPFSEGFEGLSPGPLYLRNGWQVSDVSVSDVVADGNRAAVGSRFATLANGTVGQHFGSAGADEKLVWFDCFLLPSRTPYAPEYEMPLLRQVPQEAAATIFYVDYMTGLLVVYDGTTPLVLTETPAVPHGTWVRLTARIDYEKQHWSLWRDGVLVAHQLAFHTNRECGLTAVEFCEPSLSEPPAAIDNVAITLNWEGRPAGIMGIDEDGDGICDDWERGWFGDLTTADATSDFDGDGFSDRAEFLAGTNPKDPASFLRITALKRDAAETQLSWSSSAGRNYTLLTATNLNDEAWVSLLSNIAATAPCNTLVVEEGGGSRRLFKIRLEKESVPQY